MSETPKMTPAQDPKEIARQLTAIRKCGRCRGTGRIECYRDADEECPECKGVPWPKQLEDGIAAAIQAERDSQKVEIDRLRAEVKRLTDENIPLRSKIQFWEEGCKRAERTAIDQSNLLADYKGERDAAIQRATQAERDGLRWRETAENYANAIEALTADLNKAESQNEAAIQERDHFENLSTLGTDAFIAMEDHYKQEIAELRKDQKNAWTHYAECAGTPLMADVMKSRDAAIQRAEQAERGICATHKERQRGTTSCIVCDWLDLVKERGNGLRRILAAEQHEREAIQERDRLRESEAILRKWLNLGGAPIGMVCEFDPNDKHEIHGAGYSDSVTGKPICAIHKIKQALMYIAELTRELPCGSHPRLESLGAPAQFEGGCKKPVIAPEAIVCADCGTWFCSRECAHRHFKTETPGTANVKDAAQSGATESTKEGVG